MPELFAGRGPGDPALVLFLNAGDPPLEELSELVLSMDEAGVDCLELAVPFPGSPTDGDVIRRSAQRALALGVDLDAVLDFIARIRPRLRHTKIVLLADWSHSVKGTPLPTVLRRVRDAGADGVLLHALPPVLQQEHDAAAAALGLPVVSTCYHQVSTTRTLTDAARRATAYVYLVARYGRSGSPPADGFTSLVDTLSYLKREATAPVAVGFGVRTRRDVELIGALGADAVIVGTAAVAAVETGLADGALQTSFRALLQQLSTSLLLAPPAPSTARS